MYFHSLNCFWKCIIMQYTVSYFEHTNRELQCKLWWYKIIKYSIKSNTTTNSHTALSPSVIAGRLWRPPGVQWSAAGSCVVGLRLRHAGTPQCVCSRLPLQQLDQQHHEKQLKHHTPFILKHHLHYYLIIYIS